jgi:hypothetical protein
MIKYAPQPVLWDVVRRCQTVSSDATRASKDPAVGVIAGSRLDQHCRNERYDLPRRETMTIGPKAIRRAIFVIGADGKVHFNGVGKSRKRRDSEDLPLPVGLA